ncbi:branched-chain amino acid ABC transporter permease [Pseudomonas sp. S 311-6]|uniref:ABC transporter permease n=1 Tax=Kerstersia gyiorum TaxID=206506 RepID=A0A171KUD2_9BURK|nr:branched-chain amino acid ABC transporter permease [Kerstersia gyiorum]MCO7636515.1 branched-chain amino acid ABC transporter permease [Pseudomonas sp. S 311-6]KAB0543716.1 branched-chain amino acid ABC transporter permease [Kerstersia gyiorum]KKO72499.1 ABC transporter permease [Kerstersia gyiorum]MCP1634666.1 branched-chain amino acid transport system permease protein [Kerstersia gyiorum]MCP1636976.1 branched-chain amino acid transport system permease protein [Kerstersia gyiorum]
MEAYLLSICIIGAIYALLAIGLNIQYGETGLINFGHVAYFAIGAYATAILSQRGVPIVLSMVLAGLIAALAAIPIGMAALRLKEDYFAIVTLGFAETVRIVVQQEDWLTNGVQGIASIPPLTAWAGASQNRMFALIIIATVLLAMLAVYLLQHSSFGRVLRAIRDNEVAVVALGKKTSVFKIKVLMFGSFLGGLAGAFYAHFISYISPEQFISLVTFYVWMSIILGGVGTMRGALLGSLVLVLILEGSRFLGDFLPGISDVQLAHIRLGVIGCVLVAFSLFRPQGIFGKAQ